MAVLDSLKPILEKMTEQGKISPELLKTIMNMKIAEADKERLSKNIDAFINGKLDIKEFELIQESKSQEIGRARSGEAYKKEQEPLIKSISDEDVKKIGEKMPLLGYYKKTLPSQLQDVLPFSGKRFLVVLHFTKDLIPFLETCKDLGLEPELTYVFCKPYRYPYREPIAAYLKNQNYKVYALQEMEVVMKKIAESASDLPIIVVEDGGYVVPLLHSSFSTILDKTIGAVEQTTRGLRNDQELSEIAIPILSVAEADIKTKIEPPHVANAVIKNIESLLSFEKVRGSNVALMGYGTIGEEIAQALKNEVRLTIYDPRPERRTAAREKGYDVVLEPYNAVRHKFLVIGCSGETSIGRNEILALRSNTYLVSATSDQKEVGIEELEALSSQRQPLKHPRTDKVIGTSYTIRGKPLVVHLLAGGYPINFWESESMPDQVSDLILSLILVSTIELALSGGNIPAGIHSDKVDEFADKYEVADLYERYYMS